MNSDPDSNPLLQQSKNEENPSQRKYSSKNKGLAPSLLTMCCPCGHKIGVFLIIFGILVGTYISAVINQSDSQLINSLQEPISFTLRENKTFQETKTEFIANGNLITGSIQITEGIILATQRAIPPSLEFLLLSKPVAGLLNGTQIALFPTGQEEYHVFNQERGFKALARITDRATGKVLFEGNVYYRAACFNPLRRAMNITGNVTFTEFGSQQGNTYGTKGSPTINIEGDANWDSVFSRMEEHLQNRAITLQTFALGQFRFTEKSLDELSNFDILFEELKRIIVLLFPLEKIIFDRTTLHRVQFTGEATTLLANGRSELHNYQDLPVVKIRTTSSQLNVVSKVYTFTLPNLNLIFPITKDEDQVKDTLQFDEINKRLEPYRDLLDYSRNEVKENPVGSVYDLAPEGSLKNKSIVVLDAYGRDYFTAKQQEWLKRTGLDITSTTSYEEFLRLLDTNPDIIWIISGTNSNKNIDLLVKKVMDLYLKGTGLFIWADNDPFYFEANALLKKVFGANSKLEGNYPGQGTLNSALDEVKKGTFDGKHPVATGLKYLYEGITICYPNRDLINDPSIQVFAYNTASNGPQASILYKLPQGEAGVVWIDTGFTKLAPKLELEEETRRYVSNVLYFICRKQTKS